MTAAEHNSVREWFVGRSLVIATRHGKEKIIGPVLQEKLGVNIIVPDGFDSDQFGTFSGEVPRSGSALEAAEKKAMLAIGLTGASLALASEGSFGPHPSMPFVPADEEIVFLVDVEKNWKSVGWAFSTDTNYSRQVCHRWDEVKSFADTVGFPADAVILSTPSSLHKGLQSEVELQQLTQKYLDMFGEVTIETDMRAHLNTKRRGVIAQALDNLVSVIFSICPVCQAPGFTVTETEYGLPCEQCGTPTRLPKASHWSCQICHHHEVRPVAFAYSSPQYCDLCNP